MLSYAPSRRAALRGRFVTESSHSLNIPIAAGRARSLFIIVYVR
jgi:hypothetical protein